VRRPATVTALRGLAGVGALKPEMAEALIEQHTFLRRVSAGLRLLGARPADTMDLAGPMPARVATALGYPSRAAFLDDYRRRTGSVRALYTEALG